MVLHIYPRLGDISNVCLFFSQNVYWCFPLFKGLMKFHLLQKTLFGTGSERVLPLQLHFKIIQVQKFSFNSDCIICRLISGIVYIFATLSLPIQEHDISLFRFSSVSLSKILWLFMQIYTFIIKLIPGCFKFCCYLNGTFFMFF